MLDMTGIERFNEWPKEKQEKFIGQIDALIENYAKQIHTMYQLRSLFRPREKVWERSTGRMAIKCGHFRRVCLDCGKRTEPNK